MSFFDTKLDHEFQERLRFEALTAGLLAKCANTDDAFLDWEIENALARLAKFLGLDQAVLIQWGNDPARPVVTHSWTAPGYKQLFGKGERARVPWAHCQSVAGKIVRFSDVEALPPEAREDKAFFKEAGIKGLISLPLSVSRKIVGVLKLASHHAETTWTKEIVHELTLLASVFAGMIERRQRQSELEERLRYETLLAELAARFINLSADEVDGAIEAAQRDFCKKLDLDLSSLYQRVAQEGDPLLLTHFFRSEEHPLRNVMLEKRADQSLRSAVYWVRTESEPTANYRRLDAKEFCPWVHQQLRKRERVIFSRRKELPKEAAIDRKTFRRYGTRSAVIVPLSAGGVWLGCVTFAMVRKIRKWSVLELQCFESLALTFANALARKRVNETLRESEERLSLATESAGVGLWSLRIQTGQVWASPRLREVLQFTPDEVLTRENVLRNVHPEDRAQVQQTVEHAIKTGEDVELEFRIVLPDGAARWLSARARRECCVAGRAELFMGALIDVTERKLADEALRQSEERLRLVLEANSEGVWDWDIRGRRAFFSPHYSGMLGYEPEEFSQDYASWEALVHPDDLERVNQALRAHIREGKEYGVEFRMRKKSGEWCWILSRGTVVEKDSEGRALRMVGTHLDITARKEAEERAQESEQRFLLMANSAPTYIWASGLDKLCTFVNQPWLEFTGRTFEQELGRGWAEGIHPDDRKGCLKVIEGAFEDRRPFSMEYRVRRYDGQYRWLLDHGVPRYDLQRNFAGYIGSCVDVTERKLADEALRRSEERLRMALEAKSEAVWDWDIGNQRAFFSPHYSGMLGYEPEEFSQDYASWKALVHPDDLERLDQAFRTHVREGKEYGVEFRMRKKSGEWCWILSRGTVVERDSEGRALRMVGTHLDITARKEAEERAQESEQRFLLMANSAPVFIWASGPDKLCTFFNQPWLEFTGRTLEQELGNGWAEGVHPGDLEMCLRVYEEAFDAQRPFTMEYRIRRYDGQYRWLLDHGVPRYDLQQTFAGYIGSCVDVTEGKNAEAEAQRSRQELAHVGRVTTLGELAGSLAHELNQPLTAILSNAQAARRFLSAAPKKRKQVRSILEDIIQADRRAAEVIVRMRTMLKKGEAQMSPLDVNTLIREVLGLIHSELVFRNVTVGTHLAPRLPLVRGDWVQLQQVVLNLVMNSCDAMNGKPELKHQLIIGTERLGRDQVQVAVSDCGPGFSPEMLEQPFEPFRTTKPHGLGLGLPICRSIINAHGGRLWLTNNNHGGATVQFALVV